MTGFPTAEGAESRVLLLVTTRKDAEITTRLLGEVGLVAQPCASMGELKTEMERGASALLMTEEVIAGGGAEELAGLIHPGDDGVDLPSVVLTRGGTRSTIASALLARLQNVTILERPASVSSIISAVQSAVRVKARQREMHGQVDRIRDLQNQLSLAMDASGLGIFHWDVASAAITWNAQAKAHFWLPPGVEVDVGLFYSIVHPDDRERTRQAVEACIYRRQKFEIEYRTVSPEGKIRWVRAMGRTLLDEADDPVQFSGTTQDITVRRELEDERNQLLNSERAARIAGERANRLKDEFLATLSHELRTPLNAIMGWVELLRYDAGNPATIAEGMAVIERNVRAQATLIDDLLDVSRIISGKVRLDVKPLDFAEVVHAALETVRPTAIAKGVRLEKVIPPILPPITGDSGRLQQVVWNLLTNAIKFTPRDGKVQLVLEQLGSSVSLSVTDTGEGIEPEFLPHVFERFRQADGSLSRSHGGLGLGLSIVKTLMEMHGGQVSVSSKGKGHGASFQLRLPVRLSKTEDIPASPKGGSVVSGLPGDRPDLSGLKVLVIDDEPDARGMMRRLLSSCRATSAEAPSAEAANGIISEFQPDLILSDIGMPGTDGYQFIREARRRGVTVPAVALTAFARSEDRVRSIQAGFQAHLTKPIEPAELLALVASLSGRMDRRS
jgi:PAS domain S-box-containing protein